jgi:hypothetical protein
MLRKVPVSLQRYLGVNSTEVVTFTQITARENAYRDAIRFGNGREIRLQELPEGLGVKVLNLALAEAFEPLREEWIVLEGDILRNLS